MNSEPIFTQIPARDESPTNKSYKLNNEKTIEDHKRQNPVLIVNIYIYSMDYACIYLSTYLPIYLSTYHGALIINDE